MARGGRNPVRPAARRSTPRPRSSTPAKPRVKSPTNPGGLSGGARSAPKSTAPRAPKVKVSSHNERPRSGKLGAGGPRIK
jgi:hypothetical protein